MSQYKVPDNWDSLPVEEVLLGGIKKKIKYDKGINTVYLLNDRGEWTGEKAQAPARKAPVSSAASSGNNAAAGASADDSTSPDNENPVIMTTKPKKSKWTPILIAIIVILSVLLVAQSNGFSLSKRTYSVIIAMENIQPGARVNGKLASVTISANEYHKYASMGGLYSASDYSAIKDFVATSFIPKDGYVTYANVGETFQATNPWTISGTKKTINIPIDVEKDDLEELLWGNKVKLTIVAKRDLSTVNSPDAYRPSSPDVEGSSQVQSIQIDTYTLADVTVIDVLNAKGNSLYTTFAGLAAIPEPYQADCLEARYSSEKQIQSDTPAYIKVEVSGETAKWWQYLCDKKYEVTVAIKVSGVNCETALQNDTYLALKELIPSIKATWGIPIKED